MKTNLGQLLEAVAVLDNHAQLARGPNWAEHLSARSAAALLRENLPALWQSATQDKAEGKRLKDENTAPSVPLVP